ncbi:MAG: hypothetical protein MI746_18125 [Pseudomonadales bacterium]|nr:hypothetical protein [Pseudomonadales bacterium]
MNSMNITTENREATANADTLAAAGSVSRTKMFLGTYTVKQLNEQGQLETVTVNIPDEIY